MTDAAFRRIASLAAYAIAVLSLLYAAVYLGVVRPHPESSNVTAWADAFIAVSGVLATFVVLAVGDAVDGATGRWLRLVGVGWALLSATHGVFSAFANARGLEVFYISATDPRGFATFGLAGLWSIMLGLAIRGGAPLPRGLGTLAIVNGIDLVALFLATAVGSDTAILVTGGLASVVLGPVQWAWIGRALRAT